MEIYRKFNIEAAHYLPNLPDGHKCRRLHGHSFQVTVYVSGTPAETTGWVMDFADVAERFRPVMDALDHRLLNEVPGLENPTSEQLARWIWEKLQPTLSALSGVKIRETCTSGCYYRGEDEAKPS